MNRTRQLVLIFLCMAWSISTYGQNLFSDCSAAFLDKHLIVNNYSPDGKCVLDSTAQGVLTVCPAIYDNNKWTPVSTAAFMVAIRDHNTGTLCMYSEIPYKQLDIAQVISKCRKGDHIVLLTIDAQLALPHNEILIQ